MLLALALLLALCACAQAGCVVTTVAGACRLPGVEPVAFYGFNKPGVGHTILDAISPAANMVVDRGGGTTNFVWLEDLVPADGTGVWFRNPNNLPAPDPSNTPVAIAYTVNPAKLRSAALAANSFSVEVWMRPQGFNRGPGRIVAYSAGAGPCQDNVRVALDETAQIDARVRATPANVCPQTPPPPTALAVGALTHVVLSWDGAAQSLTTYVNNDTGTTQIWNDGRTLTNWAAAPAALTLGGPIDSCNASLSTCVSTGHSAANVKLYLVAFYATALSQAQVATLNAAGPNARATTLRPTLTCPPDKSIDCGTPTSLLGAPTLATSLACEPVVEANPNSDIACGSTGTRQFSVICGVYSASCVQTVIVRSLTTPPPRSDVPIAAIVGGVLGGLLLIALVVVIVVLVVRHRRANRFSPNDFMLSAPLMSSSTSQNPEPPVVNTFDETGDHNTLASEMADDIFQTHGLTTY